MTSTIIMKFGGASVSTPDCFSRIACLIIEKRKKYNQVVVVVSAMSDTTDKLITLARKVNPNPPKREYDMLVSVGERISISLLAMALELKGCVAKSFTGSQSGIITSGAHSEAQIVAVKPFRLLKCLDEGQVAIVAGFQGVSEFGEITTLGRGGSDISAVALAAALKGDVEFYKDVGGIFDRDPKAFPEAKLISEMNYSEALQIAEGGAEVLSPRCIQLAEFNGIEIKICDPMMSSDHSVGTIIRESESQRPESPEFERAIA